jgi:hypothetical protein
MSRRESSWVAFRKDGYPLAFGAPERFPDRAAFIAQFCFPQPTRVYLVYGDEVRRLLAVHCGVGEAS